MTSPHFLNWIEARGRQLRAIGGIATFARLDPFDLASKMNVAVVHASAIEGLDDDVRKQLLETDPAWDAGTLYLPDGSHLVVMNPKPTPERQNSSLMEELAHIHLKHKPAKLRNINGVFVREWKQGVETQAYWVGAAALVPRHVVKGAITRGIPHCELARQCGVSRQLIEFREKILGIRLVRIA